MTAARERTSAQWLCFLLAACALVPGRARADAGLDVASAFEGRDTPSAYCLTRLLAPLRALSSTPPLAADGEWQDEVAQAASDLRAALRSDSDHEAVIETLIASVPDPIESGLVHQFETSLQALRTGVEHPLANDAASFFRDRSFLPWDDRELPSAKREPSEACRTVLPGLLLFRNSEPRAPRVLAMLLVGEAPTTGMRGTAMLNALRIARLLEGAATTLTNDEARVVRVVGPVFSGSAYSLRLALRHYAEEVGENHHLDYRIISGTANGADLPNLLRGTLTASSRAEFDSTIPPDADIECVYLWFLRSRLGVSTRELGQSGSAGRDTIMPDVATLSELGTEFGAGKTKLPRTTHCPATRDAQSELRPGVSLAFPIHVSNLRDAYESLDEKAEKSVDGTDKPIARATSLDAPLTDARVAQDVEADPSDKTRAALDVMLTSMLSEISRRGIRHVGIRATDVGDAIFLARKIRDVAPDVRLAFFDSDALLLHPEFRSVLLGSLVVSAYPFLGVDDLAVHGPKSASVRGFPNALTEGMFNAVLAQRGASKQELLEYAFNDATLPVWISTISRSGLEPTEVRPVRDQAHVLYDAAPAAMLSEPFYTALRGAHLPIDPALPLPRLWVFVVLGLMIAFAVDQTLQSKKADALSDEPMPRKREGSDDRAADRAIARTKWWLYAAIRTFLFVIAFAYLGTIYFWVLVARDFFTWARAWRWSDALHGACCLLIFALALVAARRCYQALRQFAHDYTRFGRYVGERLFPRSWSDLRAGVVSGRISMHESPPPSAATRATGTLRPPLARWSLSLGLGAPVGRDEAARISFAQLRNIAALACALTAWFSLCLVAAAYTSADWAYSRGANAVPTLTLNVLRSLPLANGISPAAPALLCIACVYAWVVGRMARISAAHQISRIAPRDGESDLVSTPIRLILYPNHVAVVSENDEGFTRCERDVLNAIWRPITGRNYVAALLAVTFTPVLLFTIVKPLSTLEAGWGTALLASALALATSLIGITMIQQVQYWTCLERLLKRMMSHRIGPAFAEIPAFARDSIDEQISRSPDELLRWAGCSRQLEELAAALSAEHDSVLLGELAEQLGGRSVELATCRARALIAADNPDDGLRPTQREAAALCELVIAVASQIMRVIESAWCQRERLRLPRANVAQVAVEVSVPLQAAGGDGANHSVAPAASAVAVSYETTHASHISRAANDTDKRPLPFGEGADALSAVAHWFDAGELQWLRRAQIGVATVITLLIHRHVRQFRYFASTLTAASLLLLAALTSYPFEPFRLLLTCTWVVVGTVVAATLWIYLQLHRNTLLSLISGTTPNRVTFDFSFFLRLFAWAGLPLLSVAAAQYPDLANLLFKIVSPFVRALH